MHHADGYIDYLNDHSQEENEPEGILLENNNISGFNEPVAVSVGQESGPFRSSGAILRRVEFDPKKLCRGDRKFISSLPKGAAIVGGFARGMYLGNMSNVGDIDLAVYISKVEIENCDFLRPLEELRELLKSSGYQVVYWQREGYGSICRVLSVKGPPFKTPYNFGVDTWNSEPLKKRWYRRSRRELDVLSSITPDIPKFLKMFDISICQFVYLNGGLYATEAALDDLAKKQFHVLRDTYPERARKYWRKGYSPIWDDLMMKVMRVATFDEAFAQKLKLT